MRVFGLGPTELVIIAVLMLVNVLPAIGVYRISRRAGFESGTSVLWAVGVLVASPLVLLALGFVEWPRDRSAQYAPAAVPPPPAPPS